MADTLEGTKDQEISGSGSEMDEDDVICCKAKSFNLTRRQVKSLIRHIVSDKRLVNMARKRAGETTRAYLASEVSSEPIITRSRARLSSGQDSQDTSNDLLSGDRSPHQLYENTHTWRASDNDSEYDSDYVPDSPDSSSSSERSFHDSKEANDDSLSVAGIRHETFGNTKKIRKRRRTRADPICSRTRSKVSLSEVPLYKLEEQLRAETPPTSQLDIPIDEPADDPDELLWKTWLMNLNRDDDSDVFQSKIFDEESDEDFRYEQNLESMDWDEDFQIPDSLKISFKELNSLFDMLTETLPQSQSGVDTVVIPEEAVEALEDHIGADIEFDISKLILDKNQIQSIKAHLDQHIQILLQTFMMAFRSLPEIAETAYNMLLEIHECKLTNCDNWDEGVLKEITEMTPMSIFSSSLVQEALNVAQRWTYCEMYKCKPIVTSYNFPPHNDIKYHYNLSDERFSKFLHDRVSVLSIDSISFNLQPMLTSNILSFFLLDRFFSVYPQLTPINALKSAETNHSLFKPGRWSPSEDRLIFIGIIQWGLNFTEICRKLLPIRLPRQARHRYWRLFHSGCLFKFGPNLDEVNRHKYLKISTSKYLITDQQKSRRTEGLIFANESSQTESENISSLHRFRCSQMWEICEISSNVVPISNEQMRKLKQQIKDDISTFGYALVPSDFLKPLKVNDLKVSLQKGAVSTAQAATREVVSGTDSIAFKTPSGQSFVYEKRKRSCEIQSFDDKNNVFDVTVTPITITVESMANIFVKVFFMTLEEETSVYSSEPFIQILYMMTSIFEQSLSTDDMLKFLFNFMKPWPESQSLFMSAMDHTNTLRQSMFWSTFLQLMYDLKEIQTVCGSGDSKSSPIFRFLSTINKETFETVLPEELRTCLLNQAKIIDSVPFKSYLGAVSLCSRIRGNPEPNFEKLRFELMHHTPIITRNNDGFDMLWMSEYEKRIYPDNKTRK